MEILRPNKMKIYHIKLGPVPTLTVGFREGFRAYIMLTRKVVSLVKDLGFHFKQSN